MSRLVVIAPDSSEIAALATDELARVLSAATVNALAGMTAIDAALRPTSALPAAIKVIRAVGDGALIIPARGVSNRTFDRVAWNLNPATSTRADVILAFGAEGVSTELLAEETAAIRLHAEATTASVAAVVLIGGAPVVEVDVPVLSLPLGNETIAILHTIAAPIAVTLFTFQADLIKRARAEHRRVVLLEPGDDRVLQTAAQVLAAGIADITFVGDAGYVAKRTDKFGSDLGAAQIIFVNDPAYLERYAEEFAHLHVRKGVTLEQIREEITNVSYFDTIMVHMDDADDMVLGATHTTAHTIVPSFQIIKAAPGISIVSSIFLMAMKDRVWTFSGCAVNPNPVAEQLAGIAMTFTHIIVQFGVASHIAMLSYSTGTSGSGPDVGVVVEAAHLAREEAPELAVEDPIQFDAAVNTAVAATKLPGSEVAGKATVFVFPSLEVGNIGYKAVQRPSGATAVGPVLWGLDKLVNDLLRSILVKNIANTVTLTAVRTQG